MFIHRLALRNYRVFEQELDLDLPPGLVGIYGPNGAGKSTLLESILFCLWGDSRTEKQYVRSSGVAADCVAQLAFEHEGHLYQVRRSLRGANSTPSAEVSVDGSVMASGVSDTRRYVESVLGMTAEAFKASVFAEQKQLAAFSDKRPEQRRQLVLSLLGVTPLDDARDQARKDARQAQEAVRQAASLLGNPEALRVEAEDAEARAQVLKQEADRQKGVADESVRRQELAQRAYQELEVARLRYEALVKEGRQARGELDGHQQELLALEREMEQLQELANSLPTIEQMAAGAAGAERRWRATLAALKAAQSLAATPLPPKPDPPDPDEVAAAAASLSSAKEEAAALRARLQEAEVRLEAASLALQRSEGLTGEENCPVCDRPLGEALPAVLAHRHQELAEAKAHKQQVAEALAAHRAILSQAETAHQQALARLAERQAALAAYDKQAALRHQAQASWHEAWTELSGAWPELASLVAPDPGPAEDEASLARLAQAATEAEEALEAARAAAEKLAHARGRLAALPERVSAKARLEERLEAAKARVENLRAEVKRLGFEPEALDAAKAELEQASQEAAARAKAATEAAAQAIRAEEQAQAARRRHEEELARHAQLEGQRSEALHLGRTAELLAEFRNTVVASVGPRLAQQAEALFNLLTDGDYEALEVDPDSYGLRIRDKGHSYSLERFSGSEVDLANLALRVAVSEHIHLQSGGSVGLLVLDEVFGPLDADRKGRMLAALERLKGRFRQVLVVTHDEEIKEQLPNAIVVEKLPGRRARAELVG